MIFFFEYGRLGNQLFQYAALKELYPNQRLVLFGFGTLKQAIESVDAIIVEKENLPRFLMAGLQRLFLMLSKLRIIGAIKETRENTGYVVKKTSGLLLNLRLLKPSYFQHQDVLEKINPSLRLNKDIFRKASDWLDEIVVKSSDQGLVFVHIRRGDYLTWPSRENPAVLEKEWYVRAMDRMREKVKNPIFLLLTDDPYYAKDCFGDQPDILISENDQLVDLALMSLCQHGILSASSFAWWGAWFSQKRSSDEGIYMAPKYWGGHRKKEWEPEGFITNWITYIE
jgi:hypothetical protein